MSVAVTVWCQSCHVSFESARDLIEHNQYVHGRREEAGMVRCPTEGCEREFDTAHGLEVHVARSHKGESRPRPRLAAVETAPAPEPTPSPAVPAYTLGEGVVQTVMGPFSVRIFAVPTAALGFEVAAEVTRP